MKEMIDRIRQIRDELWKILMEHGRWMSQQGANVYFAYQRIRSAYEYLEQELRLLEKQ